MARTSSDLPRHQRPHITGIQVEERDPDNVADYKVPSKLVLHEALRADGEHELSKSVGSSFLSGAAGGLSMGLSAIGAALLHAQLPDTKWRVLLTSMGFTLGFIVVMTGRQGLITENALNAVLPVLTHRTLRGVRKLLRLWAAVIPGNLLGVTLFALVATHTGLFSAEARQSLAELGKTALEPNAGLQFIRAVAAGWIVTLALWVSVAARARVMVIFMLTWLVGVAHLAHVVSGSAEALCAVFSGQASFGRFLLGFLLPVLVGNLLGGSVLVASLNHASVAHEQAEALAMRGQPTLRTRGPLVEDEALT